MQHLDLLWIVTLVYMFQSCWWKTLPGTCCFHWRGNICRNFGTSISMCSGLLNILCVSGSVLGNSNMRILIRQLIIVVACGWGLGFSLILIKAFRLRFQNEWRTVHPFGWFCWIFFSNLVSLSLLKSSIIWLLKKKSSIILDSDKIVFEWLFCCVYCFFVYKYSSILQEAMAYDMIIGTTKIVNGNTITETFMEKLGANL